MQHRAYNQHTGRTQAAPDASQNIGGRLFMAATIIARKGYYAKATKLLEQARAVGECSDAEYLDLQARIYAQQGLYLHAESCWRRAQSLDGSNPAYADALDRLRRAHRPMGHLYQVLVLVVCLAVLGLLLWQIVFVNSVFHRHQEVTDRSLSVIYGDISTFQDGSQSRDQDLAASISGIAEGLRNLDSKLYDSLGVMPTVSEMTEGHNMIAGYVDERIERIEMAIGRLEQTISGVESAKGKHVSIVESGIRQDMKTLATSAEITALRRSVSELQMQLAQLATAIRGLRQSGDEDDAANQGQTRETEALRTRHNVTLSIDAKTNDIENGKAESTLKTRH